MEFIDAALFESSSFELSYKDPTQKWLIRNQLRKLFQEFPCFIPSVDEYVDFDGTTMNLINICGFLNVSTYLPEVPLIIWLHENYPFAAPMIRIIISNDGCQVHKNHPWIDPSGAVTPPYLHSWDQTRSNLCDLTHDLVSLFQRDHPFVHDSTLKATILDDLVSKISDDLAELDIENQNEIDECSARQAELQQRGKYLDQHTSNLKGERDSLERRVVELREYNSKLSEWLTNNRHMSHTGSTAHVEIVGVKSKMVDCRAADKALEDVMYALDKALEQGVMELDAYMRQVRALAREQYFDKAMLLKLKRS